MLMRTLIIMGMLAIGVLVWKLLQRQETGDREQGEDSEAPQRDDFGW